MLYTRRVPPTIAAAWAAHCFAHLHDEPILTDHPGLCKLAIERLQNGRYFIRSVKCLSVKGGLHLVPPKSVRDHFCLE
jgi:hypothetical protein